MKPPAEKIEIADGYLTAINSFTFYQNQLPASPEIQRAVLAQFC